MSDTKTTIQRAVDHMGSQKKLAVAMECSQQQIAWMLKTGRVTAEMAIKIERATGKHVTRYDLRADLFSKEETAA